MLTYPTLQGTFNLHGCARAGCAHIIALSAETEARLRENHAEFFCPANHSQSFMGETETEKRARLERERLQGLLAQETRRREESERQAADAEKARLKAEREAATVKRTLRKQVKVASNAVAEKGELKEKVERMRETRRGGKRKNAA